jgi:DNA (cytosine-5)-methyltransferase 1
MGQETLRMIDLFAGIGGIRLGFEQAFGDGVANVFSSEWDRWAARTYQENFGDEEIAGDITLIGAEDIPAFDICLAGFPCQAFSAAGRRMGFSDDYKGRSRGTLFAEVVRICEHHRPKVIFCENVKGLVRHDGGKTFKVISGAFEELGYRVFSKVLNSRDFGVPQNRERIYIVCFRDDIAPDDFEFPLGTDDTRTLRDILEDAPIPSRYYLSDSYLKSLREHRARHEAAGHGFGYVIRDLDGPSGTIVCGGSGREGNLIVDHRRHDMTPTTRISGKINSEDVRKLTPREWARLQGFPDDFVLTEADTHLYKQLGNSVTVPVIKAIAERIRDHLRSV